MTTCPSIAELERLPEWSGSEKRIFVDHIGSCRRCQLWLDRISQCQRLSEDLLNLGISDIVRVAPEGDLAQTSAIEIDDGYSIVSEIARGGQSIVYKALQASTSRLVAIKVLRDDRLGSHRAQIRFEREVEIVSNLDHPNIITIFDSGRTGDGRRYFVMDYIDGRPLGAFVKAERPALPQLLSLFIKICEAVNHAHQRGVLHRDLKPSNIIVDVAANPFVLDFGIAKRLASGEGSRTTTTVSFLGTIPYMSPEQVHSEASAIDTRSDIYALGVILYEMLTGVLPHDLKRARLSDAVRIVRYERPQSPRLMNPTIRGDLETTVLKALEKNPSERYGTPLALAEDIRRYLQKRPILARRPTWHYRLSKLVQRRKGSTLLVAITVLALAVAGTRSYVSQARADRAIRSSKEVHAELLDLVITTLKPSYQENEIRAWGRRLDDLRKRIDTELTGYPEGEAALRMRIGFTYAYLGDEESPAIQFEKALALLRAVHAYDHADTALCLRELGTHQVIRGRYSKAESLLRESLTMYRRVFGPIHPEIVIGEVRLGSVLSVRDRLSRAEAHYRSALAISQQLADERQEYEAICLWYLARVLNSQDRIVEAESCIRRSIAIDREINPDWSARPSVRRSAQWGPILSSLGGTVDSKLLVLANIRYKHGDLEEAQLYAGQATALRRRYSNDTDRHNAILALAGYSWARGDYKKAELMMRDVVARLDPDSKGGHTYVFAINSLGVVLRDSGALEEGERWLRVCLARATALSRDNGLTANAMTNLAKLLHAKGALDEAELLFREGLALRQRFLSNCHRDIGESLIGLGLIALDRGDLEAAEPLLREAVEIRGRLPDDHWLRGEALSALGACLSAQGRRSEAESVLLDGHHILTTKLLMSHKLVVQSIQRLVGHYETCRLAGPGADANPG